MRTLRQPFPHSERVPHVNATGSTLAPDAVVDLGGLGWGVVITDILDTNTGMVSRLGHFRLPKVDGVAFVPGQAVGWHTTNKNVVAATGGKPIGVVVTAAATGDTHILVDLNQAADFYQEKWVGDASGGQAFDTGFGKIPAGAVTVLVTTTAGVPRTLASVILDTGGNAGKINVTTTAGAADDITYITAHSD